MQKVRIQLIAWDRVTGGVVSKLERDLTEIGQGRINFDFWSFDCDQEI